jgi:hypothetical protein
MDIWLIILGILLGAALAIFLARKTLGPRLAKLFGDAYGARFQKQLKKNYPQLAERFAEFEMGPGSQEAFQAAMTRLPPQEAMKLQTEFQRLQTNFLGRHPELAELWTKAQDPRGQMKAMDAVMKFAPEKRQTIEKDLLWAWDQLRGRFPKLMGPLEAAFKKKA